jgi:hypothetical protein
MKIERDYQRTRLYRAEWELLDDYELISLVECWNFLDEIIKSSWFLSNFPETAAYLAGSAAGAGLSDPQEHRPNDRLIYLYHGDRRRGLKLRPGYRRRYAESCYATITLPLWSRNHLTLIHELAHICCWCDAKNGQYLSAHGKEFAEIYLTIVKHVLGSETFGDLHAAMLRNKVRIHPEPVQRAAKNPRHP